jgi:hypothetical protein
MYYIFHKLFGNAKHIKFQLSISLWCIFVQNGLKIHFSCIYWGAPIFYHVAKTIPKGWRAKCQKRNLFCPQNLGFFFCQNFICLFFSWFCMMSPLVQLLQYKYEIFNFSNNFYKFHGIGSFSDDLLKKENCIGFCLQIWSWGLSHMCLTPKIPWDRKLVNCCLGSLCEEKYIFFNFFF